MEIVKAPEGIALADYLAQSAAGVVELIDGVLIKRPQRTAEQSAAVSALYRALSAWDFRRKYLSVYSTTAVAQLKPDDRDWIMAALVPDIIGYSTTRLQEHKIVNPDYRSRPLSIPPRLVAEVSSPVEADDLRQRRVALYLENGAEMVWMIDSETRAATVYRPALAAEIIPADGVLTGDVMLPGFEIPLAGLFAL